MVFLKLAVGSAVELDARCGITRRNGSVAELLRANIISREFERLYSIFGVALLPSLDSSSSSKPTRSSTTAGDNDELTCHEQMLRNLPSAEEEVPMSTLLTAQWDHKFLVTLLRSGANNDAAQPTPNNMDASHRDDGHVLLSVGAEFVMTHRITFVHLLVIAYHAVKSRRRGLLVEPSSSSSNHHTIKKKPILPSYLRDFIAARQGLAFPEDADILLPISLDTDESNVGVVALLRASSAPSGTSTTSSVVALNDFLNSRRRNASSSVDDNKAISLGGDGDSAYTSWGQLTICPRRSPPPSSAQLRKNARVAMIENVCDMRAYNHMMAQSAPANNNSSHKSGILQSSSQIVPSAASVGPGGKRARLDPALAKLGLDKTDIANIASVVHQPIDHRRGANTAPGRNNNNINGASSESYSSFMKDLTIGIDMRLMSLAGGVVGYYVCYSRGQSVDMCLAGAAVGAVAMLLVDAVLLLIRLSKEDGHLKATSSSSSMVGGQEHNVDAVQRRAQTGEGSLPQLRAKKLQ